MKATIYTKTGDKGQTSLVGGTRVPKTHARLEAYGSLDELSSQLGVVRSLLSNLSSKELKLTLDERLQQVQNALFCIGSHLACESDELRATLPSLTPNDTEALEADMDRWEATLPKLQNFILPGGTLLAAQAHVARAVCRRAERSVVRLDELSGVASDQVVFLNRLSDWLFLASRKINAECGCNDVLWRR